MRIRKEREDIALRMDDVRSKHEAAVKTADVCPFSQIIKFCAVADLLQKREELNTAVHDIELAVERGKANDENEEGEGQMVGLEMLLKEVAGKASSKSDEGGMLKQIKEFNVFLERAALALENRG